MSDVWTLFGPPGTGKTTRLAREIGRAVERFGRDRVVVASLTTTAAAEIKGRGIDVDPAHVGTLHAVCKRALFPDRKVLGGKRDGGALAEFNRQYARTVTATGADEDDPFGDEAAAAATESDKLNTAMQLLRMRMIPRPLWPDSVQVFASEWDAWKAHTGTIDYTDMIERAYQLGGACPFDPAAIFYDEAQDGSALELALVKQWAQHTHTTVLAGDDDQALFQWRGASVKDFLSFSPIEYRKTLPLSYRLPRAVHAVAERWVRQITVRQPKDYAPRDAEGWVERRDYCLEYPEEWMPEVRTHLDADRSVMILASCHYLMTSVLGYLRRIGMMFHNPYRPRATWNPVSATARRVLAFLSPPWTWETLALWSEHIRASTMPHGSKSRIAEHSKDETLVPYADAKAMLGPLLLAGNLEAYELSLLDAHRGKYKYLLHVLRTQGVAALRTHMTEVQDRPGKGLIVGTIHSVKGGEADVVYLWPELSPAGHEEYTGAGRDNVLRVMYVGMTRAREGLVLCAPRSERAVAW